jgi:selenocysteine lyase/cysteine desulfurase
MAIAGSDRTIEFPAFKNLTYLNTASIGLVAQSAQRAGRDFDESVATLGTTGFDEDQEIGVLDDARTAAAALFGADPECVAIGTSFTELLCQIVWWLRPGEGTNVVSTDIDFPSVTYPWHRLAQETGTEVRLFPVLSDPGILTLDAISKYMDEQTAVLCISHVQYLTGSRLDLEQLADLAHAYGALLVVDATQSAGQVPIDVRSAGVDVLIAGGYKWLCSTFGAAACYLSPELLDRYTAPMVGWRSAVSPYNLDAKLRPLAKYARGLEFSTMSYTAAVTLARSLQSANHLDPARVLQHNLMLGDQLIAGLDRLGATILTPREHQNRAGIVTARFPGHAGEAVAKQLTGRGVIVSPRVNSTRFSMHHYNNRDDIAQALTTLADLLG